MRKITSILLTVAMLLMQPAPYAGSKALAEDTNEEFIQTDWFGGASSQSAQHPGNKTGWNKYTNNPAKDQYVSALPDGKLVEATQDFTLTDTLDEDFEKGTLSQLTIEDGSLVMDSTISDPFVSDIGQWSTLPELPSIREYSAFVKAGNYVYCLWDRNTFARFDIANEKWEFLTDIPGAIGDGAALEYPGTGDFIYALRGGLTKDFYKYSISAGTWTKLTSVDTHVGAGGSLASTGGNTIYCVTGNGTNKFYSYSISGNSWTALSNASTIVVRRGSLVYPGSGDYVYLARGQDSYGFYRYSISGGTWSNCTLPASSAYYLADLCYPGTGNYLYAYTSTSTYNRYLHRYNFSENTWESLVGGMLMPVNAYKGIFFYPGAGTKIKYLSANNYRSALSFDISSLQWDNLIGNNFAEGGASCYDGSNNFYVIYGSGGTFYKYSVSENKWTTLAACPVGFSWGASLAYKGGYVYALRGGNTNTFYRYDVSGNSWLARANVPGNVYMGGGLVAAGDYLYALRGYNAASFYRYDPSANSWNDAVVADALSGVYHGGTLCYPGAGDYIYASKGYNTKTFWKYSISGNTWTSAADSPVPFYYYSAGLVYPGTGDYLYAKFNWTTLTSYFGRYKFQGADSNVWELLPSVPTDTYRYGIIDADTSGNVYFFGSDWKNSMFKYDTTEGTWSSGIYNVPNPYYGGIVYPGGDYLYMFYGEYSSVVWKYSMPDRKWVGLLKLPFLLGPGSKAIYPGSGNYIYVIEANSNNLWEYDFGADSWEKMASAPIYFNSGSQLAGSGDLLFAAEGSAYSAGQGFVKYTISTNTWETLANLPVALSVTGDMGNCLVYVPSASKVYWKRGNNAVNFYAFDTVAGTWSELSNTVSNNVDVALNSQRGSAMCYPGDGDYIYLFAGVNNNFFKYSISGNTWTYIGQTGDVVNGAYDASMCYSEGEDMIYMASGYHPYLFRYSLSESKWDIPTSWGTDNRWCFSSAGKGEIYLGGYGYFYRYDINSNTLNRLRDCYNDLSVYRDEWDPALVYSSGGNCLYGTRGRSRDNFMKYSISSGTWSFLSSLPANFGSGHKLAVFSDGSVFAMRGDNTTQFWHYNPTLNQWASKAAVPAGVYFGSSLLYPGKGNYLYATTGYGSAGFYRYSADSNVWQNLADVPALLGQNNWDASYGGTCLAYPGKGDYIYLVQGAPTYTYGTCNFFRYSISNDTWEEIASLPYSMRQVGMLLYPGEGEYLYLFRGQGTYDLSKYYLFKEGIYTSEVKTIGNNKSYGTVNWTSNNKGLIELYARTADNISLTDATSWKDVPARAKSESLSSSAPAVTAGEEYLQYQLKLYADDTENLPSLSDITVQYKKYPQVQTIVSSPYNSTFSQNRLMGLKWSQTLPAGTGVRFQLRTSADSGGSPASWSSWLGPEGTQTFNYDFSDPGNYAYAPTIEVTGGLARLKKMFQDFLYAQRIAIDNSEGATTYTDVSVPIEITAANDHFWENIKNDGSDMRFVDWEGNILKYYKGPNAGFSFDYSSKYTKVMVQIPSVPAGQKIYIYLKYGNSEALDAASALSEFSSAGASFEAADFSAYNQQSGNGGYTGVVFDGRYIYYVPYYNAVNGYNGIVMRYDTRYSADTDSAWSRFDAGNINSLYTRGYSGAVFDGRYIYFSPYYNSNVSNYYHGNVLRYDTQGDFDSTGSWAAYDASVTGGLVTKGYQGAAFDGRYVYFVPFYNNNVSNYYHGNVLRYDTQGDFNSGDSWASYDASATGGLVTKGYQGAVFDGRYLYFVPHSNNNVGSHGYVLRFDTQGNFNSSDSWVSYNAGSVDFMTTTGYKGASFDGRYIYFAPSNTNWNTAASGNILRYDTEGAFNETNSWSAYNAGGIGNLHTKGYSDAVYDGRYVYFSPYYTSRISGNYHGNVLRLDSQGDFKTADSWVSLDASETDGLSTKGFTGVVSDGNNLYFSPYPAANFLIFNRANLKEIPYYFATLEDQATCVSLSGWQYRSDVDIDNLSGPDMSDYQVKVTLTKDLTESFWARCMENGYDVRFVDSDNTTILPYYRASFNYATKTAEFWIKIPSISASSTKRLYLYYGKADAADVSSFDDVFIKDFNEIGYNTSAVSLDGVDSKLSIGDNNALDISGNLTLEANVKYTVDYWPQGWSYCKTVTLDNSAGTAKTDFVVAFEVPKDAAMNADYSDLRFWETDKSRRLRYNIASSDENSATVWVLIPSLPAGSTKDILMYYGNASAASEADEDIAGVTTNGLAAWWKFDESSGTSAADSSGNGYTGTLVNNPAWVEGKYGNALSFNGTNSYVSTSYGLNTNPVTTPRTYAAWVKSNSISTSKMYLSQSDGTARAYFGHSGGYWSMGVHGSGWGETTGGAVNTNWHHVAIVFDGSAAKFYLDGNYVYQKTYTSFTFDQNLLIGAYRTSDLTYTWSGLIDEVVVYNRALSESEVQQVMAGEPDAISASFGNAQSQPETLKWMAGYSYRKKITIDNSDTAEKLNECFVFDVDYIEDKMNADYSDLRFVDTDGKSMTYSVISYDDEKAQVMLQVPIVPQNSTKDFFMYYGNTEAVDASDASIRGDGVPVSGLQGRWKFDEGSGTSASDTTGLNSAATLVNNPTWVAGKSGTALQLNGSNQYVNLGGGQSLKLTLPLSFSFWINLPSNISGDWRHMVSCTSWSGNPGYDTMINSYQNLIMTVNGSECTSPRPNFGMSTDEWHLITYTVTSNASNVYIDAVPRQSWSGSWSLSSSNNNTWFGYSPAGSHGYFRGIVDDLLIYNRALSLEEIESIYSGSGLSNVTVIPVFGGEETQPAVNQSVIDKAGAYGLKFTQAGLTGVLNGSAVVSTPNYTCGSFFDAALVYDGAYARLYINGVQQAAEELSGAVTVNSADIIAGDNIYGAIDELRVWNIARESGQIKENKRKALIGNESGLAMYLPCNENSGTTADNHPLNPNSGISAALEDGAGWLANPFSYSSGKPFLLFHMDEGVGEYATDSSGNGIASALTDTSWSDTDLTGFEGGKSLNFNGTSSYGVSADNSALDITGKITLEAWIKPDTTSGTRMILFKGDNQTPRYNYKLYINMSNPGFSFYNGSEKAHIATDSSLSSESTYHIAATFDEDSNTVKIYVNGEEVYSESETSGMIANNDSLYIGKEGATGSSLYDGLIDEVRIYKRVLTADEIKFHYEHRDIYFTALSPLNCFSYTPPVSDEIGVYAINNPVIQPVSGVFYNNNLEEVTAINNIPDGTGVKYQISPDGVTWYWFDAEAWTAVEAGYAEANTADELNTNLSAFQTAFPNADFYWRAYLNTTSALFKRPSLNNLAVSLVTGETYYTDYTGGDQINSLHSDAVNDQWFQYKAYLYSDGSDTPILDEVTSEYINSYVSLTSPDGGEEVNVGASYNITWNAQGITTSTGMVKIEYSADAGSTYSTVAEHVANTGTYSWTVPDSPSYNALIKITSEDLPAVSDVSAAVFKIIALKILAPNGGEIWEQGKKHNVTWQSAGQIPNNLVRLEYSTNNGGSWVTVSSSIPNTGTYEWTVPQAASDNMLLRMSSPTNQNIMDVTDAVFSVLPTPVITVSSPQAGDSWNVGTTHEISWRTNSLIFSEQVVLQYSTDNFSTYEEITTVDTGTPQGENNNDDIVGTYQWAVADAVSPSAKIRVKEVSVPAGRDTQTLASGLSGAFAIAEPVITLTNPDSSDIWVAGDTEEITWSSEGEVSSNLTIEYSLDGETFIEIATEEANDGSYSWQIPQAAAGDSVYIRITDGERAQVNDTSESFKVFLHPHIAISTPNGGEDLTIGTQYAVTWSTYGRKLAEGGSDYNKINIYYSIDSGENWTVVSYLGANTGSYNWEIPDTESSNALIKITDDNDPENVFDVSDAEFSITLPKIFVTSPNGSESWYATGAYNITWDSEGSVSDNLTIEYSDDNGSTWEVITTGQQDTGTYTWPSIADVNSQSMLIRITDISRPAITDVSDANFSIIPPELIINAPNGGEEWVVGEQKDITWASIGKEYGAISDNLTLQYSSNAGSSWSTIDTELACTGSYTWTIPDELSNTCLVKIFDADRPATTDTSDGNFKIVLPYIKVTSPDGGEQWAIGTQQEITWTSVGAISDNLTLEYSTDDFVTSHTIDTGEANDNSYTWTVPDDYSVVAKVRITDASRQEISDTSGSFFAITYPVITITSPNGSELWTIGDEENITWTNTGSVGNSLKIEYSKDNFSSDLHTIIADTSNSGIYGWEIPEDVSASVRVRITDNGRAQTWDKSDNTFTILPMPEITISAPAEGDVWRVGTQHAITWSSNGGKISNNLTLQYSTDNGLNWKAIASAVSNSGSYTWTIPNDVSETCLVKITDSVRPTTIATSPAFEIGLPLISITSPNGGEYWAVGDSATVLWDTEGTVSNSLILEYSTDGGSTYNLVSTGRPNTGSYTWTVPNDTSSNVKFRITDGSNMAVKGVSETAFSIIAAPTFTIIAPNGGEEYVLGDIVNITWTYKGLSISDNIVLDFSADNFLNRKIIATGLPNTGSYTWTIPEDAYTGSTIKVRITDGNRTEITDVTNGYIRIRGGFTLLGPNGSENWLAKSPQTISWQTRGTINTVKLEYTTDGTNWNTIASPANTGSYPWTLPDVQTSTAKVRISDVDDSTVKDESDTNFNMIYGTVVFKVLDYDTLQHLADFSVSEPATGWTDSGLNSPLTRSVTYPYGTYTTFITKANYIDNSVTWSPPKQGTEPYNITIYIENAASAQVTWDAILNYSFSPATDTLTAVGSLQRKGKLVGTTELERLDMGAGTLTIYEPDGVQTRMVLTAATPSSTTGMYNFTYANTGFEAGKVYPATLSIDYRERPYVSSANIDVGSEILQYQFFTETATKLTESVATIESVVTAGTAQTRQDIEASRQQLVSDLEKTGATVKGHVSDVLASAQETLQAKVEEARVETETARKSQILNRENAVRSGQKLTIRYRTYPGLIPTIDVYDANNVQRISKASMAAIGTTGIYEYDVDFLSSWGKGDFTIVCSEAEHGTLDAMIISVIKTDLEHVYNQISAVMGNTSGLSSLSNVADGLNSQFGMIEAALSKVGKDMGKRVQDAVGSATTFDSLFSQISGLAKQIKNMGGDTGVNLEKLYQVSSDKKEDINYLKNKTQELRAVMDLNQKMIQNISEKPVVQRWYEYK